MKECASALWPEQTEAPPRERRPVLRQRHHGMAEARTKSTGAPTTPLPATRAKQPAKRARAGLVIGVVIVAAGVGGYLALERGVEQPGGVGRDTVRIRDTVRVPAAGAESGATTRATPPRRHDRSQARAPAAPAPAAVSQGSRAIDASPSGEVHIDGTALGQTPVAEY